MVLLGIATGVTMSDTMGTFRVEVQVENPVRPGPRVTLPSALVDTGAELSWFPAPLLESLGIERYKLTSFRQASGNIIERWIGLAYVYAGGARASDDVVFGEPGRSRAARRAVARRAESARRSGEQTAHRCRAGARGVRRYVREPSRTPTDQSAAAWPHSSRRP